MPKSIVKSRSVCVSVTALLGVLLAACGQGGGEGTALVGGQEVALEEQSRWAGSAWLTQGTETGAPAAALLEGAPLPVPSTDAPAAGELSTSGAWTCADPLAMTPGSRHRLDLQLSTPVAPGQLRFASTTEVTGPTTFNGFPVVAVKTSLIEADTVTESTVFVGADNMSLLYYGGSSDTTGLAGTVKSATTNLRPVAFRYDLSPGESFSQSYDAAIEVTPDGAKVATRNGYSIRQTVTFSGIESVTVPAGTFQACKFEFDEVVTANGQVSSSSRRTTWLAVGIGVAVKIQVAGSSNPAPDSLIELVGGDINGVAVEPLR